MKQRTWQRVMLVALLLAAGCAAKPSVPESQVTPAGSQRSDLPALVAAADRGDTAEVGRLLATGAALEATDARGRTALIAAAYGAHLDTAELLLNAGADTNSQDQSKQGAYLIATSEIGPVDGLALLRLTLAHGADVTTLDSYNGTGLIRAAHRGYRDIVGELLATNIDIDHVNGLRWTALLEAIILGGGTADHVDVVRQLLTSDADVNCADGDGVTPLAHARARGYVEMEALLLAAGAR